MVMPAIVGFLTSLSWTQVSLIFLRNSDRTFESTVTELTQQFFSKNVRIVRSVSFDEDSDDDAVSDKLQAVQNQQASKVVVALALESAYLKLALASRALGMVSGWAWLGLDTVPFSADYAPLADRADANLAFNGWVYVEPFNIAGPDFFDRVHNATQHDFPTFFDKTLFPGKVAASMYDAITIVATAANRRNWSSTQDGLDFVNKSLRSLLFEGKTGPVKLDENGDLLEAYHIVNLVVQNGTMLRIPVGKFSRTNASYESYVRPGVVEIIWPGGRTDQPVGVEVESADRSTIYIFAASALVSIVLIGAVVYHVKRRFREVQHLIIAVSKDLIQLVLHVCLEAADLVAAGFACAAVVGNADLPQSYKDAYKACICLASVAGLLSVACHFYILWQSKKGLKSIVMSMTKELEWSPSCDPRRHQVDNWNWQIQQGRYEVLGKMCTVLNVVCEGTTFRNRRALGWPLTSRSAPCRTLQIFHS